MSSESKAPHIQPEAVLDRRGAEAFYAQCKEAFQSDEESIVIDASAVERITTPCAQIITSLGHTLEVAKRKLEIINASDAFKQNMAQLGLSEKMELWSKS